MLYLRRVSTTGKHKVFLLYINILLWVFPRVCRWMGSLKSALGNGSRRGGTRRGGRRMKYVVFIKIKGFRASPSNNFPGKDASPGAGRVCVRGGNRPGPSGQ